MIYKDFSFRVDQYNKLEEYTGSNVFVLAVRNILLSRPGNFPLTPSLGMDIEKYLHEFSDEVTLNEIKTELTEQINKYVENVGNLQISVELLKNTLVNDQLKDIIAISVLATINNDSITTNFILYEDLNSLNIYNETY